MPLKSEETKVIEEGRDKNAFVVTFTNGALEQLEELKAFLGVADKMDVIKMAVSVVQNIKDKGDRARSPDPNKMQ